MNYLRAFSELDGCEVVAACDVSEARLREAQRRSRGIRTTTDIAALIEDPDVNAVIVATQATRHYPVVSAVLDAGKPCLVEKPMTTDIDEARRLRDLAVSKRGVLMVGHVFRYNAAVNVMQKLLISGALGQLEYLTFTRTNLGPIRDDVNVVWDLMTHDVSILLHFMNETPSWVSAQGASYLRAGCEDVAFATVGFERGVVANIRASWLDPRKVREITVVGTSKMAFFNDLDAVEPIRVFDKGAIREPSYESFGEFKLVTRTGEVVSPAVAASEPLKNQCQHFLRAVGGASVLSDADDGLRVVSILHAINQSMAQKGAPQSLTAMSATASS